MTDNEIIKALEGAILNSKSCDSKVWIIAVYKLENALDLINRQHAEIDRLKEFIVETRRCDKEIKSEAVKEFAEKLKNKWFDEHYDSPNIDFDDFIDNLLKEMVGEEE